MRPEYGETWVYESFISALPGVHVSERVALAIQFLLFEGGILALSALYGPRPGTLAGTAAVVVATAGSFAMLRISRLVRRANPPEEYRRLLFGSSIEVVLGVLAYVGLVTYLFVYDPRQAGQTLLVEMLGENPPIPVVLLALLILWDLCYRIGTGWWASVAALWRSARYRFDPTHASEFRRADLETMGFGLLQLLLVPFLTSQPLLLVAVVGHVIAVLTVSALSLLLLYTRTEQNIASTS